MKSKKLYQCSSCDEIHDFEHLAEECCQPEVYTVYQCSSCSECHDDRQAADSCCEGDGVRCPACAREYKAGEIAWQAVTVANHCPACNPIYTIEERLLIEDLHFKRTDQRVDLSRGE